jgi:hypothetical protein
MHIINILQSTKIEIILKCNLGCVYKYICTMESEITIPDHFPDRDKEDLKAADKRREVYSINRDLLAKKR